MGLVCLRDDHRAMGCCESQGQDYVSIQPTCQHNIIVAKHLCDRGSLPLTSAADHGASPSEELPTF
jgi:hypothetical protein